MYNEFGITIEALKIVNKAEESVKGEFDKIDKACELNSLKVLNAFKNNNISEVHFTSTTGYGYDDIGRSAIENVFKEVLGAQDAIVRNQFVSGSHALCVALFAYLRPNDLMLSISGTPYDTLHEVIGIKENESSLKAFGVRYHEIDLKDNDFDYEKIEEYIKNNKVKLIEIQRSKGYSVRKSITIDKVEKVVDLIKKIDDKIIIMVDNCYCEFVEDKTPLEVGADIMIGSLIKNLGGGLAPNGAYIAGRKKLVDLAGERLTLPGEGREVGPTLGINKMILQGLFMAPSVVASSLKIAVLTSKVMEGLGYKVEPRYNEKRADIVQNIIFGNEEDLVNYCVGIQSSSPVDSLSKPVPWDMPGYDDKVVMAAGTFTQGSSIELSCDGPIREPYIAYQQGGLTYQYGKIAIERTVSILLEKSNNKK